MPLAQVFQHSAALRIDPVQWADLFYPLAIVSAGAVVCALAIDLMFGEPPQQVHPVVWMGKYLEVIGLKVSRVYHSNLLPLLNFIWGCMVGLWVLL